MVSACGSSEYFGTAAAKLCCAGARRLAFDFVGNVVNRCHLFVATRALSLFNERKEVEKNSSKQDKDENLVLVFRVE